MLLHALLPLPMTRHLELNGNLCALLAPSSLPCRGPINSIATERLSRLCRFGAFRDAGFSYRQAADLVRSSPATIWRWTKLHAALGIPGLQRRRPTGRSSPATRLQQARSHAAAMLSLRRLGLSQAETLRAYACRSEAPRAFAECAAGIKPSGRKPRLHRTGGRSE